MLKESQQPDRYGFNRQNRHTIGSVQLLSCVWLCDPMDCSTPGLSVLHYLPELAQTHVHWVGDAIQASHPPLPSLLLPSIFPSIRVFSSESALTSGGQSIGASASASFLPMNIQDWFTLGWLVGSSYSPRNSQESSPAPQLKSINSLALSFLYGSTFTSVHDREENYCCEYMDLCQQSDVSAF